MPIFSFWLTGKISNTLELAASTKHLVHGHTAYIINFILHSEQKWLGSHCFVDWQREAHGRQTHNQRPKHGCKLNTDHTWQNHAHSQIRAHRSAKTNRAVHGVSRAACVASSNTPLSLAYFFLFSPVYHGQNPTPVR